MPIAVVPRHAAALEGVEPDGNRPLVAIGVRAGHLDDDLPSGARPLVDAAAWKGEPGDTLLASTDDGVRLLVGIGPDGGPATLRKAAAAATKRAAGTGATALVLDLIDGRLQAEGAARTAAIDAMAQGAALGSYRFGNYKDAPETNRLADVVIVARGGAKAAAAVERGVAVATAIALVRDMVNTPGGDLTPTAFAARAETEAAAAGLEIEVWGPGQIARERLGGLLGVARGSAQEPRFLTITHRPEGKARGRVALVGKGVTFDSGGLSIKTSAGMDGMKGDMAGAAAVLGAMTLVPTLAPKLEVVAYLPLTDNMLGPDATRVGDVLRARNGKTIEVLNTDAEGRLILADGLSLAAESEPQAIVDVATLTGAVMVALGDRTAGVMGNNETLRQRVLDAAAAEGEAMWPLPLPDHLRKSLDSEVADLRNIGVGAYGGALTAGIFLREFVGDVPWVHLDIAGPSATSAAWDEHTKGGTGFGVRTLVRLLAGWSKL